MPAQPCIAPKWRVLVSATSTIGAAIWANFELKDVAGGAASAGRWCRERRRQVLIADGKAGAARSGRRDRRRRRAADDGDENGRRFQARCSPRRSPARKFDSASSTRRQMPPQPRRCRLVRKPFAVLRPEIENYAMRGRATAGRLRAIGPRFWRRSRRWTTTRCAKKDAKHLMPSCWKPAIGNWPVHDEKSATFRRVLPELKLEIVKRYTTGESAGRGA